jgi:nucleotide-binding universal stress UspA family protein
MGNDTFQMPEFKKILFATDLSSNSGYASFYAESIARQYHAEVIIVSVIPPLSYRAQLGLDLIGEEKIYEEKKEKNIREIKGRIESFCRRTSVGGACCMEDKEALPKILCPVGHPSEAILNVAEAEHCDLIVVGSHGKGFLQRCYLGSVSKEIAERSSIPVLIIPSGSDLGEVYSI